MERTWDQLQGYQPTVMKMLANSIEKNRVAHAYLFEGMRGTGKKDISLLFAKSLFCLNKAGGYKPCGECSNCKRITSRNHPDVHIVEPDGQSIKKWQIQSLQEEFAKTGMESNKKLYIIEHSDRMTANAANSLLKFLEEPGKETVALLLTEQIHRMLDTILSRCQILSFKPLPPHVIAAQLMDEGVPRNMAALIAHVTNSTEEALEMSRNDWFAQSRAIVIQLYEVLASRKNQGLFLIADKWMPHFKEKEQLDLGLDLLLLIYKDLLNIQIGRGTEAIYMDKIDSLKQSALKTSQKRVSMQMGQILEAKGRLNTNMNPHLLMEQLVLKLQEG